MMKTYTAIFECTEEGIWSAHIPELPTILVEGSTFEQAKDKLQTAIELHIEDLKEQGLPFPGPSTQIVSVEMICSYE